MVVGTGRSGSEEDQGLPACQFTLRSQIHRAAVAVCQQEILLFRAIHRSLEIGGTLDGLMVDLLNDVALLESRVSS